MSTAQSWVLEGLSNGVIARKGTLGIRAGRRVPLLLSRSALTERSQLLTPGSSLSSRATIVADPSPPPIPNPGAPSLPPLSQPIIGTGDAGSLKDAEKLAALHACLQLGARGLFTESNLPTRTKGMRTPLHAASSGGGGGGGGGGGNQFPVYASTGAGNPAGNDGKTVGLSGGQRIGLEEARAFMDYYCASLTLPPFREQAETDAPGVSHRHSLQLWQA